MTPLDRRSFLLATGALALAACGSDKSSSAAGSAPTDGYALVPRFARELVVPGNIRMPFSLGSDKAVLSDGPETLTGRITDASDKTVLSDVTAKRRRINEGIVYWDFHVTLETVGLYTLFVDGGTSEGTAISVNDPASVLVPYPGQQLPGFDTPTTTNAGGVNPICTRLADAGGPCPFHDITLNQALATGKAVVYLIGTPAHCEFGTCAPGLEYLIAAGKRLGEKLSIVHAEVYTDDTATVATPAIDAYHLRFEPMMFLADRSGKLVTRLEGAWNQDELDETLNALVA